MNRRGPTVIGPLMLASESAPVARTASQLRHKTSPSLRNPCFEPLRRLSEASVGYPSERFAEEEESAPMASAKSGFIDEVPSEEGYPTLAPPTRPRIYGFLTSVAV